MQLAGEVGGGEGIAAVDRPGAALAQVVVLEYTAEMAVVAMEEEMAVVAMEEEMVVVVAP